jgi:hypothetical protein
VICDSLTFFRNDNNILNLFFYMLGCEVPSKYYLHYNVCFKYLNNFFFRMTCAPAAQKMEPATQRKTEFF